MSDRRHLVLLEGSAAWSGAPALLVHWDRSDVPTGEESIPRLAAGDWRALRTEYLGWIYELGETRARGGTVKTLLRSTAEGPSMWWLTLMAEKSPMKSRTVHLVFKLRTLEKLCETRGIEALTYRGGDRRIDAILAEWCRETGRAYEHAAIGGGAEPESLGKRVGFLPHGLRGLAWLAWTWWTRVRPVRARRNAAAPDADTAVVTYFPNCDLAAVRDGRFLSVYWQDLHELLDRTPGGADWIWLYVPTAEVSLADALDYRDRCNGAARGQHFWLLEEFVGPAEMWRAIRLWAHLAITAGPARRAATGRRMAGSRLNLAPVLEEDWRASLLGIVAAEAAYYVTAFDAMAAAGPAPARGLYVFEQQPWELALVAAWKRAGAETVIAHQHEAVKPLNLRLFDDPRGFGESGADAKPRPDVLAVGSADARAAFVDSGWPEDAVRTVESLRFRPPAARATGSGRQFLLVTGYLAPETRAMLGIAAEADRDGALAGFDGITIKPHPFLQVDAMVRNMEFASPVTIGADGLDTLWPDAGFAFLANSTAAVFDAVGAGVPCAVCEPDDDLNLSPALGIAGIAMIADAGALGAAIRNTGQTTAKLPDFCAAPGLPRWRELLETTHEEMLN